MIQLSHQPCRRIDAIGILTTEQRGEGIDQILLIDDVDTPLLEWTI
jgi:hypothetical protein